MSALQSDQKFKRLVRRKFFVNTQYQVPNLVGMSKNSKTIYIDSRLKLQLQYHNKSFDCAVALMTYQVVYWGLIHEFDFEPKKAKMFAKRFEKMCTDEAQIPWNVYIDHLRRYLQPAQITKCPPDFRFFFGLDKRKPKINNNAGLTADTVDEPFES